MNVPTEKLVAGAVALGVAALVVGALALLQRPTLLPSARAAEIPAPIEAPGAPAPGHAESVQVTYDPAQVRYSQLLQVFFSVVHDPTQLNYQGPDHGTQYRSAVYTTTNAQLQATKAYIAQLTKAKAFP